MTISTRAKRERRLEAARGYLMLSMPDHALRELELVPNPERIPCTLHRLRGEALQEKEDYAAALKAYDIVHEQKPDDVDVLLRMAWCYKRTDQLHRAIEATQHAYHVDSTEPIIVYNLACYFALDGDKPQALSWLGRALRMDKKLRRLIDDESDFDSLRNDPDFQMIVEAVNRAKP